MLAQMFVESHAQLDFAGPVFPRSVPQIEPFYDPGITDNGPFLACRTNIVNCSVNVQRGEI